MLIAVVTTGPVAARQRRRASFCPHRSSGPSRPKEVLDASADRAHRDLARRSFFVAFEFAAVNEFVDSGHAATEQKSGAPRANSQRLLISEPDALSSHEIAP